MRPVVEARLAGGAFDGEQALGDWHFAQRSFEVTDGFTHIGSRCPPVESVHGAEVRNGAAALFYGMRVSERWRRNALLALGARFSEGQ